MNPSTRDIHAASADALVVFGVTGDLAVTVADLQSFRQAGSHCTGHPEHGWTTGVETTTGPLGQGVATSVGMAIEQAWLAATYSRPGVTLFEHRVFALGWNRYVGRHGEIIAMRSFGLSAPGKDVQAHFGFDVAHLLAAARRQLQRRGAGVRE
jgi:transketolase